MKDMKISTRLTLGFGVMAVLIVLCVGVSLVKVNQMSDDFDRVLDDRYPVVTMLNEIKSRNTDVASILRNLLLMTDPADIKAQYAAIGDSGSSKVASANMEAIEKAITSPKGKALLADLAKARSEYRGPRDKLMAEIKSGNLEAAKATLFGEVRSKQLAYIAAVDGLIKLQDEEMKSYGHVVDATVVTTKRTLFGVLIVAIGLAAVFGLWLIRTTTRPLVQAVAVARGVAAGDLTMHFDSEGKNETAQLLAALKDMQTRLAAVVGDVRLNAEGVATASAEIASGNSDLSARTENQASALEETAASMEQLGATVRTNADNAQQANQLAMAASSVAVKGGGAVQQVIETMKGISDSSKKIADIIGVIDGIAFQTNILALNAAVEAARAGEQGRGFAVVASEVRSLAQRSADAAKQIKVLITQSVERVEQGTTQVGEAGTTIDEVVASIRRVTDIVGEISAASREQSAGVAQVGEAVVSMDKATQQNAALVEESSAAAETLKAQAEQLVKSVAVFKLESGAGISAHASSAHASSAAAPAPKAVAKSVIAKAKAKAQSVAKAVAPAAKPAPAVASAPAPRGPAAKVEADEWESF
jgi:methyl-accepting chemotaxis protein